MPSYARNLLIPNGADCLVHTISRCVRRAWLCGDDAYTGKNFDHRREWVRERAKFLVSHFAVDVLAYAVMSNHSHFVLWVRPSVASGWSAEDVARRWLSVFGKRVNGPTEQDVARAVGNAERIARWRGRLGDLSWFMRCLNEWLARKANAEDECTGRFWEGRFTSQLIEDEGALLACMAYVDLNPVRARIAASLEESQLTSVHDRICAMRARKKILESDATKGEGSRKDPATQRKGEIEDSPGEAGVRRTKEKGGAESERDKELTPEQLTLLAEAKADCERDAWLCRFGDDRVNSFAPRDYRAECFAPRDLQVEGEAEAHTVLGMGFADYLALLEWTGKCVVEGRVKGSAPRNLVEGRALLERMGLDVENWVGTVERYGSLYHRVAGKVENLKRRAREMGLQWVAGQRKSRGVFRAKARGQSSNVQAEVVN